MNAYTLILLKDEGLLSDIEAGSAQLILHELPFPLWSLDLQPLDKKQFESMVGDLREERTRYIAWWYERARRRDPKPTVTRGTIEELTRLYDVWYAEQNHLIDSHPDNTNRSFGRIVNAALEKELSKLQSYRALEKRLQSLGDEERMDLAALAWFGRNNSPPDWEAVHQHARKTPLNDDYLAGLGNEWRKGLERWESTPDLPASLHT